MSRTCAASTPRCASLGLTSATAAPQNKGKFYHFLIKLSFCCAALPGFAAPHSFAVPRCATNQGNIWLFFLKNLKSVSVPLLRHTCTALYCATSVPHLCLTCAAKSRDIQWFSTEIVTFCFALNVPHL